MHLVLTHLRKEWGILLGFALVVALVGPALVEKPALAQGVSPAVESVKMKGVSKNGGSSHVVMTVTFDQDLDITKVPSGYSFTLTRKYSGETQSRGTIQGSDADAEFVNGSARKLQFQFGTHTDGDALFLGNHPTTHAPYDYELSYTPSGLDSRRLQDSNGVYVAAFSEQAVERDPFTATFTFKDEPSPWDSESSAFFTVQLNLSESMLSNFFTDAVTYPGSTLADGTVLGQSSLISATNAHVARAPTVVNADKTVFTFAIIPRDGLNTNETITVTTRVPTAELCATRSGHICTVDRRPLSSSISVSITVSGVGGI